MKTTIEILKDARALVAAGWIKGTFRTKRGEGAPCYCAMGAVRAAAGYYTVIDSPPVSSADYDKFDRRLKEITAGVRPALACEIIASTGYHNGVPYFNDRDSTTKEDVLEVFDKAIASEC